MFDQKMAFQVGDQVIHWMYGLGEIVRLDEKVLDGRSNQYYVVRIRDLVLWVPLNEAGEQCLRFLTPAGDFHGLFCILASPGESLPSDRFMRKTHLTELIKSGTLESICRVIRDLAHLKRIGKMNESDNFLLERARNFLLNEWSAALSVPIQQAENELRGLLGTSVV